ncbi:MAG: (deoxy)nucleoside triphosphate pyrophosphohydrolase [Candidatus Acidiferrales bacterium]
MRTVVAALIEHDGKLLVCQRKRGDRFGLLWEFPGGKVEPGELPHAAIERELLEELGVRARIGAEVYRTKYEYKELPGGIELIFFAAEVDPREIKNLEFEQMEWRRPESLPELEFLPADRDLINLLAGGKLRPPTSSGR